MKFEDMKLIYGYPMQLQSSNANGQPERYSCRLIGCLPGRAILLSVPKMAGKLVKFRTGQKVVARLMVDNGIGIFASTVETQTVDPYPILHITYPDTVSFKGIRGATRVAVDQSVEVSNTIVISDKIISATVVDISVTGARIECGEEIGSVGDSIQLTMQLHVANMVRELTLDAIVRSKVDVGAQEGYINGMVAYGVEFINPDEERRLVLYAFVYAQIGSDEIIGS